MTDMRFQQDTTQQPVRVGLIGCGYWGTKQANTNWLLGCVLLKSHVRHETWPSSDRMP
ncbi:MAG: hypothetical protein AAFQ89_22570 [Cyanobacteria bacterium J06626_18]